MKRFLLIIVAALVLLSPMGCKGGPGVYHLTLFDFIGDWFFSGQLDMGLEGRTYTDEIDTVLYIREGVITDEIGYSYTAMLANDMLVLKRDAMFKDYDPYCGDFEGGTELTFVFPHISPFFDQAYEGSVSGETAVFTKHCNYKTLVVTGVMYMQKVD